MKKYLCNQEPQSSPKLHTYVLPIYRDGVRWEIWSTVMVSFSNLVFDLQDSEDIPFQIRYPSLQLVPLGQGRQTNSVLIQKFNSWCSPPCII